jgi:hypothetical protein
MEYKKYSLEQVENFLYDAMSTEATSQEIYDVIKGVVEDNYCTYKVQAEKASEFLALLNGNRTSTLEEVLREREYYESTNHSEHYYDFDRNKSVKKICDKDDPSEECKNSWADFWENQQYTEEELNAMCYYAEQKETTKNLKKLQDNYDELNKEHETLKKDYVKALDEIQSLKETNQGSQVIELYRTTLKELNNCINQNLELAREIDLLKKNNSDAV